MEFKTFTREGIGIAVHAHIFEPVAEAEIEKPRNGKTTSQHEYRRPLLEALLELGGSGRPKEIYKKVHDKMKDRLKPKDFEKFKSGYIRYENAVAWERVRLIEGGYLKKDSPRGVWEITHKGKTLELVRNLNDERVRKARLTAKIPLRT